MNDDVASVERRSRKAGATADSTKPSPPRWRTEGTPPPPPPTQRSDQNLDPSRSPGLDWKRLVWIVAALLVANWLLVSTLSSPDKPTPVSYTEFRDQALVDNVAQITSEGDTIEGTFRAPVAVAKPTEAAPTETSLTTAAPTTASPTTTVAPTTTAAPSDAKMVVNFTTERPTFADDTVFDTLLQNEVVINAKPLSTGSSFLATMLFTFGPVLLLVAGYIWLMRRMGGGMAGGIGSLGRSKAIRSDASAQRTTFDDVAGIDEATAELVEIVDFLRDPDRYRALGARPPRGVLLMGPPGTGKTLLARATAGEAGVPFFSMSASEFIEMIVGVGASRVRDLFDQAKAVAPAIIFIDELDAIGRARGSSASFGGVDEREQTLNQILTEMDGFSGNEGVIVLAATNRPDVLDPALLRAGRFDRRIMVNPPDQRGRAAILGIHTKGMPLADDADLGVLASTTPGMVGADLANLANEAALLATRRNNKRIEMADFTDALEHIILGAERKIMLTDEDRRRTAYHESGHALLGMLEPGSDPVRKVSIIPRGRALGVTFQSPTDDRYAMSETYLRGRIVGALGGRVAEELVFGEVTTGAESDLEQVTSIAREMVGRWGMSAAIGPMSVLPSKDTEPVGFGFDARSASEHTRQLIDSESRVIVDTAHARALDLLSSHRSNLEALAKALLEHETLDGADAYTAAGIPPPAEAIRPEPRQHSANV